MLTYLGLSALAVFALAIGLSVFSEPSTLAITHLVLVGAIVPLIFGAITHFVPVLTRGRVANRAVLALPLVLQVTGLLVFLHFSGWLGLNALYAAAGSGWLAATVFVVWLVRRASKTLGRPHPCWRWYFAAILVFIVGSMLVPPMYLWGGARQSLRLLHLHLNTLGFIGLTAIGTLQVLLPTALSAPDPNAAARLQRQLLPTVIGVLMVSAGAAFWRPLSVAGAALLAYPVAQLGHSWWRRYGLKTLARQAAGVSLSVSVLGLIALLVGGTLHAFGWLDGRASIPAFFAAFLLPLVTGALTQLLPVWWHPGRRTVLRDRMQAALGQFGLLRSILFLIGGILFLFARDEGVVPVAAGLLLFLFVTTRSLLLPRAESEIIK